MFLFPPGVKRLIKPSNRCLTLECPYCQGVEFRVYVEPLPNGACIREIVCKNVKCARICEVTEGLIGGKERVGGQAPHSFDLPLED